MTRRHRKPTPAEAALATVGLVSKLLESTEHEVWEAAQAIQRNAERLVDVTRVLERHGVQARAQMVLDRLVPDIEELLQIVDNEGALPERIYILARQIGDRLGLD